MRILIGLALAVCAAAAGCADVSQRDAPRATKVVATPPPTPPPALSITTIEKSVRTEQDIVRRPALSQAPGPVGRPLPE